MAKVCRSVPVVIFQIECPPHVVRYDEFDVPQEYREDWDKFNLFRYV